MDFRSEAKQIAANKKGQFNGHRSSFRKQRRVFVEMSAEQRAAAQRRRERKRRQELDKRLATANAVVQQCIQRGFVIIDGPKMEDFIEVGSVNMDRYSTARADFDAHCKNIICAAKRMYSVRFEWKGGLDAGCFFINRKDAVKRA